MSKKTEEIAAVENAVSQMLETGRVDTDQIERWKKEHKVKSIKEVACRISENETAYIYLKEPNRDVVILAMSSPKDTANRAEKALKTGIVVLNNCLIGGDERVHTDDMFYNSAVVEASAMIEFYETTSKNL